MEAAVERSNMLCAYKRVVTNEGAPGAYGLTVTEFKPWFQAHWPKTSLVGWRIHADCVRKLEISKP